MAWPDRRVPLSRPSLTAAERDAVVAVLETQHLSLGPKVDEFEENLARYVGTEHAVAVNSGTSALHLAVKAAGIGDGHEVITTPFSFIASASCVLYERAIPVFVDIDRSSLNIDVTKIEDAITERTKGILPVDIFGLPSEMNTICDIARSRRLSVIEDACEALGATYDDKMVGTLGDCAVFAFYPNKQITTAEGGAIVTDNSEIAALCRSMRNHGRDSARFSHVRLGYNYRLSDLHCAIGIAQLARIDSLLAQRAAVAKLYAEALSGTPVELLKSMPGSNRSWWVFVVLVDESLAGRGRDRLLQRLQERGIGCSDYFPPIHLQPFYVERFGYKPGDFPVAESIAARTLALPFYAGLSADDVAYVAETLDCELKDVAASSTSR